MLSRLSNMNRIVQLISFNILIFTANEVQLRADVTTMQAVAVQKFTQRNYKKACDIFLEALAILQKILPPNHDECVQLMNSVEACKRRIKDSGQM